MVKKKLYNEQKILVHNAAIQSLETKLIKSFQANQELNYINRLSFFSQKKLHFSLYYKTKSMLRCFYSHNKSVPAKTLGLSRFVLSRRKLNKYLANYVK